MAMVRELLGRGARWPVEELLAGGIDLLGVATPQPEVEEGLHDALRDRELLAAEVAQVADGRSGFGGDGLVELGGQQGGQVAEIADVDEGDPSIAGGHMEATVSEAVR